MLCCSCSVCRPSQTEAAEQGLSVGVVFRGHHETPLRRGLVRATDRNEAAEESAAGKDLKTWKRDCRSCLSPVIQWRGTERSESNQRTGKGRVRLRSEEKWSAAESPESGSPPRRQSATFSRIQRSQQRSAVLMVAVCRCPRGPSDAVGRTLREFIRGGVLVPGFLQGLRRR